jgi:cell division protein FtsZ
VCLLAVFSAESFAKLTVIGVGGAGGNIVSRMQALRGSAPSSHNNNAGSMDDAIAFVIANTDAQALAQYDADEAKLVQLGPDFTSGLGAGTRPDVGAEAATESIGAVMDAIGPDTNLVFIAAGMGGGTGTGAAPVIARACRAANIVTVGLATLPFEFEGAHRARVAHDGIATLASAVDALALLPNQRLLSLAQSPDVPFVDAFRLLDSIVLDGVQCISDLMAKPALVNLDFADVRTVLQTGGLAMLSTGKARGERRAHEAAVGALTHPLWHGLDLTQAKSALISIVGDASLSLNEVRTVANLVTAAVAPDANVVVGTAINEARGEPELRVSLVITGIPMSSGAHATTNDAAIFDSVRTAAAREDESSGLTQRLQTVMEKLKQWW